MIFNLERPIVDQLLDSILEHPEEWEIVLVSGNPCKHRHKNGVELWVQNEVTGNIGIWEPASCKAIEFTEEEKRRLHKAVIQIRKETEAQRLADAKNIFIQLMNKEKEEKKEKKHIIDVLFDFSIKNGRAIGLSMILLAAILAYFR